MPLIQLEHFISEMYNYTKSILDKSLINSIFLTTDFDCTSMKDKLSGVIRGRKIFIIPFNRKNVGAKTTPGSGSVSSEGPYLELMNSF